jgi:hypothetical protein
MSSSIANSIICVKLNADNCLWKAEYSIIRQTRCVAREKYLNCFKKLKTVYLLRVYLYNQVHFFYAAYVALKIFISEIIPSKFVQRRFTIRAAFEGRIPRVGRGFTLTGKTG